jgi:hypothetical protein
MKTYNNLRPFFIGVLVLIMVSCSKDDAPVPTTPGTVTKSSAKEITGFSFSSFVPTVAGTIDASTKKITATVPPGTDVTKLVPTITVSDKATISAASGVALDFSKPVTYMVKAEDGSTQAYDVVISVIINTFSDIVQKVVPIDVIEGAKLAGVELYGGSYPPNIEGTFKMSECIIADAADKSLIGRVIQPITYNFSNYNAASQSIVQRLKQSNGDNGSTASTFYASGAGNLFTIFRTFTGSTGIKYYQVMSGELTSNSIKNFKEAIFYYENKKAVVDTAFKDKDGVSEKQTTF